MDSHFPTDEGATKTLERISAGGRHLVTITRQRIGDALNELDEGDFRAASTSLQTAVQALGPLAHAENYIAVADALLMDTRDLQPGMVIVDVGEITEVEVEEECGMSRCDGHVKVKFGEHEYTWSGRQQVYVQFDTVPTHEE